MVERAFEMELDRQFGEAPFMPDAELFAVRVTDRLDRGWTLRQLLIGGLGVVGGLIGAVQVLGSGLMSRLSTFELPSTAAVKWGLAEAPGVRTATDLLAAGGGLDVQVLWMSAALAALAVGLFVTRVIREF